jgi:hypothetical protein
MCEVNTYQDQIIILSVVTWLLKREEKGACFSTRILSDLFFMIQSTLLYDFKMNNFNVINRHFLSPLDFSIHS